jgi:hypothetical protein
MTATAPIAAADRRALEEDISRLEAMNIDGLRQEWRERFGGPPPPVRAADVLRRFLAERIQLDAFGGDTNLDAELAALVKRHARGEAPKVARPIFRPGTVLIREHAGQIHRVEVRDQGFLYAGRDWASLSKVAREITGVRWNGPRFFGLRDGKTRKAKS